MAKRTAAKRELIDTGTAKRYAPGQSGRLKESDDVGRSRQTKAKTKARPGQGDKGAQ